MRKIATDNHLFKAFHFQSIYSETFSRGNTGIYLFDVVGLNKTYTIKTDVESRAIFRVFLLDFTINSRIWIYNGNIIKEGKVIDPTEQIVIDFTCDEKQFTWNIGVKNDTNTTTMKYVPGHRYALIFELMGFSDWVSKSIGYIKLPYCSTIEKAKYVKYVKDIKNINRSKGNYKGRVLYGSRVITPDGVFFDTWFDDGDRGFLEESCFYVLHNNYTKSKKTYTDRSTMTMFTVKNNTLL